MNKLKMIENRIKEWKAALKENSSGRFIMMAHEEINDLEAALAILKEPSNTQMQMDATEPKCGTHHYCNNCCGIVKNDHICSTQL